MGKGDKKSRRGKIILGSSGVRRPKSSKSKVAIKTEAVPAVAIEKTKKVAEKPKAEHKPKVKVAETVAVAETEITAAPAKTVKKAVKKAKEDVAE
jgi:ribosomal small subunit protein bTHX